MNQQKKKLKIPHMYVVIFIILIFAAMLTYILPAGSYNRYKNDEGRTVVEAGSYEVSERTPATPFSVLQAIPKGLIESADVVFMVFLYGGAFGVINGTGVVEMGINSIVRKSKRLAFLLVPILLVIFSMMGGFLGLTTSTVVFVPLCISLGRALGYDALFGLGILNLGLTAGFTAGPTNMYTTGVAQGIAELPIFSGMGVRMVLYAIYLVTAFLFLVMYGARIKKDPTKSFVYEIEQLHKQQSMEDLSSATAEFTSRKKLVLFVLLIGLAGLVYGIIGVGWSSGTQISAYLIGLAIVIGFIDGKNASGICTDFVTGAKGVLVGALVVGLARAILVVLTEGNIIDTFLYGASCVLGNFSPVTAIVLMFTFQWLFNFLVNSGSGQAAATMPLMVPLGDLVGVTRQCTVLAFQAGDGLTNIMFPTAGRLMATLSIAEIPYDRWARWVWPFMAITFVESAVFLMICVLIGV